MENKYFVPDIEDIRVGYECEISDMGIDPSWTKCIVSHSAINHKLSTIIPSRVIDFIENYHPKRVRVPYLTKEQIEAEGWTVKEKKFQTRDYIEKGNFMGILETWGDIPVITLIAKDVTKIEWLSSPEMFRMTFPCKDINTFRYICKLLKVNG